VGYFTSYAWRRGTISAYAIRSGREAAEELAGHRFDNRSHHSYHRQPLLGVDTIGSLSGVPAYMMENTELAFSPAHTRVWPSIDTGITFITAIRETVGLVLEHLDTHPQHSARLRLFLHVLRNDRDLSMGPLTAASPLQAYHESLMRKRQCNPRANASITTLDELVQ